MRDNFFQDKALLKQLQKLTLERLRTMPDTTEVAIGSDLYSKTDLMDHVNEVDDLGKQIMTIQLDFLRDLASGEVYKDDFTHHASEA
jgi:hypothetical protein